MKILVGNVNCRFVFDDGSTPPSKSDYIRCGVITRDIYDAFSFTKPNSYYAQQRMLAAGKPPHVAKEATMKRFISLKTGRFGIGLLNEVRAYLDSQNYEYDVVDLRKTLTPSLEVSEDILPNITLRDYQVNAFKAIIKHQNCLIQIPTGGGKCVTGETLVYVRDKHGERQVEISSLFSKDHKEEEWRDADGLEVLSKNGWKKVTKLYRTNLREIYRLTTKSGVNLRGVGEHRVATDDNEWTFLNNFCRNKKVCILSEDKYIKQQVKDTLPLGVEICMNSLEEVDRPSQIKNGINKIVKQSNIKEQIVLFGQLSLTVKNVVQNISIALGLLKQMPKKAMGSSVGHAPLKSQGPKANINVNQLLLEDMVRPQVWQNLDQLKNPEKPTLKSMELITTLKVINSNVLTKKQQKTESLNVILQKKKMGHNHILKKSLINFVKQWQLSQKLKWMLSRRKNNLHGVKKHKTRWKQSEQKKKKLNVAIYQQNSANFMFMTVVGIMRKLLLGGLNKISELLMFKEDQLCATSWGNAAIIVSTSKLQQYTEQNSCLKLKVNGLSKNPWSRLRKKQQNNTLRKMDIKDISLLFWEAKGQKRGMESKGLKKSWMNVVSVIKEDKLDYCYDFQVEDDHCYWTNGILSHNTADLAALSVIFKDYKLLYVMDKVTLTRQTSKRFIEYGVDPSEICTITAGTYSKNGTGASCWNEKMLPNKRIILCIQQMADKVLKNEWDKFDGVIVDESHHARAKGLTSQLKKCKNARLRVGTSGTTQSNQRIDDMQRRCYLGPVVYAIKTQELIDRGHLVKPIIRVIEVERKDMVMYRASNYQEKYRLAIVEFDQRNSKAIELAKKVPGRTLVLFRIIEHGRQLMKHAGYNVEEGTTPNIYNHPTPKDYAVQRDEGHIAKPVYYLDGNIPPAARDKVISAFGKEQHAILIASTIFDEGIDLPGIESLVICTGEKSFVKQIQRLGRALRLNNQNVVFIFDFYDWSDDILKDHSEQRMSIWLGEGHEIKRVKLIS